MNLNHSFGVAFTSLFHVGSITVVDASYGKTQLKSTENNLVKPLKLTEFEYVAFNK